ncbi:MAG TPA: hypothetical protein VMN60_06400, partial [Longimicrobiales bacterium]|nr:hypothetical protein [Longimicrobiales bacterium]
EQYNETSNDPTLDLWTSDVVTTALRLQHARGRADLHADFGWRRLEGDARRGDLEGVTISAAESDLHGALHARVAVGAGVALLVQAGLGREERTRRDRLERQRVEIEVWTTQLAAGVEASPTTSLRLAAGVGFARYGPTGGLPDPRVLGEAVRQFVFPEYSFMSAPADVVSASARVGWAMASERVLWLSAGYASTGSKGPYQHNFAIPDGERSAWNLALSIEM